MKADSLRIAKVFNIGGDVHYILPHFQREYAWEKPNWQTLLKDLVSIYDLYSEDNEPEHFMGALMVINDGTRNGTVPAFKLVDGQQRLTTISLILCVLSRIVENTHPAIYKKAQRLLTNPDENGDLRFKLLPTMKYGDRDAYTALLTDKLPAQNVESRIPAAFDFFHKEIEEKINSGKLDPEKFFIVLTNCLQVVFIDLDQRERPYEIFESLNSKGKPLSQADLVRNYIAMKLPERKQTEVFSNHWSKIETLLQERRTVGRSRLGEMTAFLRHYLAFRNGVLCNEEHVYARFRDRIERDFSQPDDFADELATLSRFAEYYNNLLRPEQVADNDIRNALIRLNILETSTAYPFLLAAYDAGYRGDLSREDFLEGLSIVENYIVRRYLSGAQTNYLNKMFPTLWREIDPKRFPTSLKKTLLSKNYPSDNRVRQSVNSEQLYDGRSQSRAKICLILDTINRNLSAGTGGHTVLDAEPTVEHIMPQSTPTSAIWKAELGENWEETYQEYLNTLGNLTVVTQEWNSSLSNAAFSIKRDKLASHALLLNSLYFSHDIPRWDKDAIRERANQLADQILTIWSAFGEISEVTTAVGQKPSHVIVSGDSIPVKSWREVALQIAKFIASRSSNFDTIAAQMPAYFSRSERPRSRDLGNGWWIYLNLSSTSVNGFCRQLTALAGINDDEWEIELANMD
jgi:uncharacterized protein with ParB-like and HNH nuclease domain